MCDILLRIGIFFFLVHDLISYFMKNENSIRQDSLQISTPSYLNLHLTLLSSFLSPRIVHLPFIWVSFNWLCDFSH